MNNNNLKNENEIKVIQVSPKLRLFLLIFSNWLWTALLPFVGYGTFHFWPFLIDHSYLAWIALACFIFLSCFFVYYATSLGIEYFPKDLSKHYVKKNNQQLQKNKNLEINNVIQSFNVIPICDEVYSEERGFQTKTKEKFSNISWIEKSQNRLVVNGKNDNLDFSWGIVTKMKKNSFKIFLLSILYFGPVFGIFLALLAPTILNSDFSRTTRNNTYKKYKKMGCFDLFANHSGKLNSENYLIFSAKLKNPSDLISLIPKKNTQQPINLDTQYEWPVNISLTQKMALQSLMKKMSFLPSIYLYQGTISIVMKKYHYNDQDNRELQTWELIKDPEADSEIQFNYLNQAIKIYQIFDKKEE